MVLVHAEGMKFPRRYLQVLVLIKMRKMLVKCNHGDLETEKVCLDRNQNISS